MAKTLEKIAAKYMADVPEAQAFRCCDGRILRNLRELGEAFRVMTDETFAYHSNEVKTDFSNWVRDTIGDDKLARDLSKSSNRNIAARNVARRISLLNNKLA